jgi:ABC-type multidrug transport system permease subunit
MSSLWQLTLWRYRAFIREPEALFWVFAFPVLLALALGIAFKNRAPDVVRVAVEDEDGGAELAQVLDRRSAIEAVVLPPGEAHARLRTGRVALVVGPGDPVTFKYDSTRTESGLARLLVDDALQEAAGRHDVRAIRNETVTEPGARYIDFLIPGLLGLNIMGTGMWGVGFGVVRTRTDKLLKRLLASPMRKSEFLLSQILARLAFLVPEVGAVLGFGYLAFGVPVRGSLVGILAIVVLGAMAFSGLGLLVASRAKTIEGVSGLMNLVMVPMWIGSGVFFAYSHFPASVQPVLKALPLTALNDALRAVMLDGSSLLASAAPVGVMATWGLITFAVALWIFRWE